MTNRYGFVDAFSVHNVNDISAYQTRLVHLRIRWLRTFTKPQLVGNEDTKPMNAKKFDLAPPDPRSRWKPMQKQQYWQRKILSRCMVVVVVKPSRGLHGFEAGIVHRDSCSSWVVMPSRSDDLDILVSTQRGSGLNIWRRVQLAHGEVTAVNMHSRPESTLECLTKILNCDIE